jgi:hypothetical protein
VSFNYFNSHTTKDKKDKASFAGFYLSIMKNLIAIKAMVIDAQEEVCRVLG